VAINKTFLLPPKLAQLVSINNKFKEEEENTENEIVLIRRRRSMLLGGLIGGTESHSY
jgi:hypothetical protein